MAKVSVKTTVNSSVEDVWESWDDYANIDKFSPTVQLSFLLGDKQASGIGALRQCDFSDGKTYVKERIVGYEKHQKLVIDIYESNAPIKDAQAVIRFNSIHAMQTNVSMTMEFTPKMGLLGKLMTPLMKMQFTKALVGLLEGNADYVERKTKLRAVA